MHNHMPSLSLFPFLPPLSFATRPPSHMHYNKNNVIDTDCGGGGVCVWNQKLHVDADQIPVTEFSQQLTPSKP